MNFSYNRATYALTAPSLYTVEGIPGAVIVNGDLLIFSHQELSLR